MISALLTTLSLLAAPATPLDQIMAERLERVVLDPAGQRIAFVVNGSGGATLRMAPVQQDPRRNETVLWSASGQISELAWLSAEVLLVIEQERELTRWWTVDVPSRHTRQVLSHDAGSSGGRGPRLLALIRPASALLSLDRRKPWEPDVYRINLTDGSQRIKQANPGRVFQWWVDPRGKVQAGRRWGWNDGALRYHLLLRHPESHQWQSRASHRLFP